ncbi:MAG: hypothetical protein QOJ93_3487 [Actinomycetota bacterium]|nr:hypothetical protein [Actinomycetota bacterium]
MTSAAPAGVPRAPARRGRGRPAKTSLAEIVDAALVIARAEGLARVSMRSVAERVGIHQMSVYGYVPTKDALFRAMLDKTFAEGVTLPDASDPREPSEQLKEIFRRLHKLAADNVELLSLLGRTQASATPPLLTLDRILELLSRLDLTPRHQGLVYNMLYHLTMTNALLVGNRARAFAETSAPSPPTHVLLPETGFPHIRRVLDAGLGPGFASPESAFEAGLDSIFDEYVPGLKATPSPRP